MSHIGIKKPIGIKKALKLMQTQHACLTKMFTNTSPDGYVHYIIPGGWVEAEVAEKIKNRPDVIAGQDCLFPGIDQTWRIIYDKEKGE